MGEIKFLRTSKESHVQDNKLMDFLRTDKELKELRQEWEKKKVKAFPPYNTDEYNGITDYKNKIREQLLNN